MRKLTADEIKYFYKDAYEFWKLHLVNSGDDNEIDYKLAFEDLLSLLHKAYVVYQKYGRQENRGREVLRILGFTINGKRPKKIKKDDLLIEYKIRIEMVSNQPATNEERQNIIDSMAKEHDMNAAALHKCLRVELAALRRTIGEMKTLKEINPAQCEELTEMYKKLLPPHD